MDALLQIAAQLGIDQTFYPLFGLMFVLYLVLSLVYLKPYQKLLHERKEKTEGAKKEARELVAQAEEKMAKYKSSLKDANDKAKKVYSDAEEAAKKEESKLLADAAMQAKTSLQNLQKELELERKKALDALSDEIPVLASEIAAKVLGRPVGH